MMLAFSFLRLLSGPAGKFIAIGIVLLALLWYARHDAANDAKERVTAEVNAASAAELLRQKTVAENARRELDALRERHETELEALKDATSDIVDAGDCPIDPATASRLLEIR